MTFSAPRATSCALPANHSDSTDITVAMSSAISSQKPAAGATGWSTADIRRLRELAEQGMPVPTIAATLRRSESAIRNKAGMHGISLRRIASEA
jgi:hypothetical protein